MSQEQQSEQPNPNLSYVYQELTKNDNGKYNLVSMVAYILYKEHKIDFYKSKNGTPSPEEERVFRELNMLPRTLASFRGNAEVIVQDILNKTWRDKILEIEAKFETTTEAEMASSMDRLNTSVNAKHVIVNGKFDSIERSVDTKYALLDSKIDKFVNRGFWGWTFEVGRAAVITFFSTLILWFVLYALKGKDVQSDIERGTLPSVSIPGQTNQASQHTQ